MDNKETNNMNKTTKRIGIGKCPATTASTINTGDYLMWNYGYISLVLDVKPRGTTQIQITTTSLGAFGKQPSNETYTRVMSRKSLVVKVAKAATVSGVSWAILDPMGSASR